MWLWIKAVLLTLWHCTTTAALIFLCAIVATALFFGLALTVIEFGDPAVVALVIVAAACFIWLFASNVRDNHERLQTKARLEENARGGVENG